jgi:uncharacterized membrane-anchored protein YhcB (DUF1043 family)
MNDFFNWNDSSILLTHNWVWLVIAFVIGVIVGYRYNTLQPRG